MTSKDSTKGKTVNNLQISGCFKPLQQEIASAFNTINTYNLKLAPIPAIEQLTSSTSAFTKNLTQSQALINSQLDTITTTLSKVGETFSKFGINLKNYADNIMPILRENNWFFTDSMEPKLWMHIVENIDKHPDKKAFLDEMFVEYYSRNNFEELDYMADTWNRMTLINDRSKILIECISVLKDSKSEHSNIKNPYYLVIPTLIAQIDGLMTDYLEKRNFTTKYLNSRNAEFKKHINGYIQQNHSGNTLLSDFLREESNAASKLLLDILFQTVYPDDKNIIGPFSRHKIMHGQFLEYGNIEDTIRLFLLFDFLAGSIVEDLRNNPL